LTGERVERRLAAELAANVAGYSRLMGRDERTLAGLKAVRKALVDPTVAAHCGRIVKTTGDSISIKLSPGGYSFHVQARSPWTRPQDHTRPIEGLRKAGLTE
jgi:class 3 adenylate cyclase